MLTTYIIGCIALIIKPGPDLMCTLATAISDGKARASTLMAGLILGCWLWIWLLSAGVASFFMGHPAVMTAIQLVGVAYIGYLAFGSFREAWAGFRQQGENALTPANAVGWRLVGRGVFMAMSNPLTILFFLAFLPNFTQKHSTFAPAVQVLLLGTLFCALVPFIYFPIILAADFFRSRLLGSAKATAILKLVSAFILAAVALVLLTQVKFQ
ncbi:MAG: LysE family translocator [Kiritimatiellae bacterium]|nr:LysE family translocator [Kiritimatiellia bacterium]